MEQEKYLVSLGMRTYGGGFTQALGMAVTHADKTNYFKLKEAFPEYFDKYYNMGKDLHNQTKYDSHRKKDR